MAEEEEVEVTGLRPFWSGTLTFGLVSVPVSLHAATLPRGTSMRMLSPDDAPVQRRYVCSKDEKPLDADDIVRGYEIEKDKFVVVTDEELEAIEPRKSREIDLRLFVDSDAIDPIFFERAWFLVPAAGANKAYRLLAAAMEAKKQIGIATFVMRAKEYVVAILSAKGILRAETLRFADEIRKPEDVGLPKVPKIPAAEVKKFETQIGRRAKKLEVRELLDAYAARLDKVVEKKRKKKEDVVRAEPEPRETAEAEVVDLLEALQRSLGGTSRRKAPRKKSSAKRSGPRKRA